MHRFQSRDAGLPNQLAQEHNHLNLVIGEPIGYGTFHVRR